MVEPVSLATTFRDRLIGIHAEDTTAILLRTRSVHGKGLVEPLRVVHLTSDGTVIGDDLLSAGGRIKARSYWLLEMSDASSPPPKGCVLRVLPSSAK